MLCSGHAACPGLRRRAVGAAHARRRWARTRWPSFRRRAWRSSPGRSRYSSLKIPVYQPTLESSAAAASGLRRALDAQGKHDTQVIVLAGDGGTYDIGFQCLSSAAERNEDFIYFCLDNEGYMNTGAQKSSSTPHFASTGSTPGRQDLAQEEPHRDHGRARACPTWPPRASGFLPDLIRKVEKAKAMRGTRIITLLIPCLDGWGLPDDAGLTAARYAVECGAFPLYESRERPHATRSTHATKTRPVRDYLALQRRYRGMTAADIETLQAEIDDGVGEAGRARAEQPAEDGHRLKDGPAWRPRRRRA